MEKLELSWSGIDGQLVNKWLVRSEESAKSAAPPNYLYVPVIADMGDTGSSSLLIPTELSRFGRVRYF